LENTRYSPILKLAMEQIRTFPLTLLRALALALLLSYASLSADEARAPATTGSEQAIYGSIDLMTSYLAAEMALQQGLLAEALQHYLTILAQLDDADIAERAARIGLHLRAAEAPQALATWTRLAPESVQAWQVQLLYQLIHSDFIGAHVSAVALITAAKQQGQEPFLDIAAAVAAAPDKAAALTFFGEIVEQYPDNANAYYALGLTLFGVNEPAQAELPLRRALALKHDDPRYWLLLARALAAQNKFDAVDALLAMADMQIPDHRMILLTRAESLMTRQRYSEAYPIYARLMALAPDDENVLQIIAALAIELSRWDDAMQYWTQLYAIDEHRQKALFFLGSIEMERGNHGLASGYYIQIEGELERDAMVQMATIEVAAGRLDAADRLLAERRAAFPDEAVSLFIAEAELLNNAGYDTEAQALLNTARAQFPDDVALLFASGMLIVETAELVEFERIMRDVLALDPDYALALNALGYTLAEQTDRYDEAYALITRALELMPDSVAIIDSMGWVLYRLERFDEALSYLKRAASRSSNGEITAHLGEVLWVMGQENDAMQVWQRGLELEADDPYISEAMQRLVP